MEPSADDVRGAVRRGARDGEQQQWLARRIPGLRGRSVRHACGAVPEGERRGGRGVRGSERRRRTATAIADFGEKLLKFELNDSDNGDARFRLANVTRPLGSVSNECDGGDGVVLESGGVVRGTQK